MIPFGILTQQVLSGPSTLLTNLTAWWNFDEESGIRYDSYNTHDLTDNGTVLYAAGKQGNAADFESSVAGEYLGRTTTAFRGDRG